MEAAQVEMGQEAKEHGQSTPIPVARRLGERGSGRAWEGTTLEGRGGGG
jgi:hypothetical protein